MDQKPNTAEPQKPRGRWFQFRLRTLLIGIALAGSVCGGYVAHEASIVRARKTWLGTHDVSAFEVGDVFGDTPLSFQPSEPEYTPSALRRWLGDADYSLIATRSEKDTHEAKRLFPEATIDFSPPTFDQSSDATDANSARTDDPSASP